MASSMPITALTQQTIGGYPSLVEEHLVEIREPRINDLGQGPDLPW